MCGIVGLFLKEATLEPKLGGMVATMLATMCGISTRAAPRL